MVGPTKVIKYTFINLFRETWPPGGKTKETGETETKKSMVKLL